MTLYVLYESASGYGLFSADGIDEIGQNTEAVRSSVVDLNRFGKVVKLAAFTPYDSALDALNQCNAISEGQMTDELRNFLELTLPKVKEGKKPKFSLGVAEPKLGSHIFEVTKIPCQSNEFVLELIRGIRLHFDRFIENLKPGDLEKAQLGLGHSYSRAKMERMRHTARRRLGPSATPEDVVRTYREYWMHWGDDLGEFLMQYLRHWKDARVYGVTDFDGVKRLLTRLPVDWEDYAREVSGDYIYRVYGDYDLIGDLPRFISHLTYVYTVYGVAPRGPYLPPREYTWHDDSPEWLYTEVPRVVDPVIPRGMEAGGRPAHVTMGSRPRVLGRPVFPPLPVGHPSRSPLSVLPPMMASPPRAGSYRQTVRMRVSDARDDYSPIRDIHAYGDDGVGPSRVRVREDDSDDDSDEEEDPEEDPEEDEDE